MSNEEPSKSLELDLLRQAVEVERDRIEQYPAAELREELAAIIDAEPSGATGPEEMQRALAVLCRAGMIAERGETEPTKLAALESFRRGLDQITIRLPQKLYAVWTEAIKLQATASGELQAAAASAAASDAPVESIRLDSHSLDRSIRWKVWSSHEGLHIEVRAAAKPQLVGQRIRAVTTHGVELTGPSFGMDAQGRERGVRDLVLAVAETGKDLTDTITVPVAAFEREKARLGPPTEWAIKLRRVKE